jgi:hypothetical protein
MYIQSQPDIPPQTFLVWNPISDLFGVSNFDVDILAFGNLDGYKNHTYILPKTYKFVAIKLGVRLKEITSPNFSCKFSAECTGTFHPKISWILSNCFRSNYSLKLHSGRVLKHFFQRALFEAKQALPNMINWLGQFGLVGLS